MRRTLRAAAGAGVVAAGLTLLLAGPARAGAPDIAMSSPTGGSVVGTSTPTISGAASATSPDGTVSGDLQVAVTSQAGHPGWSTTRSGWCGQSSCPFSLPVSPGLAWNGAYTLSVQATETDSGGQSQPVSYEASFSVAAPAATPSGLTATPSADGRSVSLAWSEPSYPDLVGYQVTRTPSGPGFPARVTGTGYTDRSTTPGSAYSYQVTALRQGATSGTTVSSAPAGASVGGTASGAGTGSASGPSGSSSGAGSGAGATSAPSGPAGSGVGTYGSAGGAAPAGTGGLGSLLDPSASASGSLPALAAPAEPNLPGDSAEPGPDLPAVAPFSASSPGPSGAARRSVTLTYGTVRAPDHSAVVRNLAAVGLAALLLAVVAHLLWLRRLVAVPSAENLA